MQLGAGRVTVGGAGLLRHLDAAIGHKGTLKGLISLQTHDLLQILEFGVNVAGTIGGQARNNFGFHIQNAALGAFFLLQDLQSAPQLVGGFGRTGEEALVAGIRLIVLLDEVTGVDFFLPDTAFKAFPLLEICHNVLLLNGYIPYVVFTQIL